MLPTMNELSVRPMPSSRDGQRGRRARPARTRRVDRAEQFPAPVEALSLPLLGARWQSALEAAQAALAAAARTLPPEELRGRRSRLDAERLAAARLLDGLARDQNLPAHFAYLTTPPRDLRRLLGLPDRIDACVFTLDGVLVGSATAHAGAWAEVFDSFLFARGERVDRPYRPFDRIADYYEHIHAKPRLEGTRSFLASRGISLPEGELDDPPGTATVRGLANAKAAALLRRLEAHPLEAYAGSRQYLDIARAAHVRRAVVSASANARLMLDRAGLSGLIDACVDGSAMVAERLRAKPAPDTLLAACRRLDVTPAQAAAFETTESGVTAARSAGFALVVGVAANGQARALRAGGADLVTGTLAELVVEELAA
jgi:HAD superfamily hydrolase (TIGR01509 family)